MAPSTAICGGRANSNGHTFFNASGRFYQKIFCSPSIGLVVVVTAADDVSGLDTLNLALDPILDDVIFNPLTE